MTFYNQKMKKIELRDPFSLPFRQGGQTYSISEFLFLIPCMYGGSWQ